MWQFPVCLVVDSHENSTSHSDSEPVPLIAESRRVAFAGFGFNLIACPSSL
jgi:hypothetical protein